MSSAEAPYEAFLAEVRRQAGLRSDEDAVGAVRAAVAVLEALGERISSGQVKDLAARLPEDLGDALRRGDARSKGQAKPLSLAEFVRRVAELEGVSATSAHTHARAVLRALRDVVGEKEFGDTLAQLPAEYRTLLTDDETPGGADGAATPGPPAEPRAPGPVPDTVQVRAPDTLPRETVTAARERLAELQRYTDRPLTAARLTLRHPETRAARSRWIADASILLDGRLLAAHATGPSASAATDEVVDRLGRQIRRAAGTEVALRNDPRTIARDLAELRAEARHRPAGDLMPGRPGDRRLVHRTTAPATPVSVPDAASDLIDHDQEFRLFVDESTGETLLAHRREDDRIGVMHPPWTSLPDLGSDVFVVESPPDAEPETLGQAAAELDRSAARFRYFVDAADGRPKVLYLRHDGDYGLVETAPT